MGLLKNFKEKSRISCFTPEVMLLTFIIEATLAVYVYFKYKASNFTRASIGLLSLLATFQIAEYQICAGVYPLLWSRIGFIVITLLPPLGLYLVSLITGKNHFLKFAWTFAAGFIAFFLLSPSPITNALCGGNYVIFDALPIFYLLYGIYYFLLLGLSLWEAIEKIMEIKKSSPKRDLLTFFIIGYTTFLLPMIITYAIYPETELAIPSVMCGFAIVFALILALKIVPTYHKIKSTA